MPKSPPTALLARCSHVLLMMLGAIGMAHAQDNPTPPDPAAAEFHSQLELLLKAVPAEVQGARIAHADAIYQFYAQRSFHPAWTNPHTASEFRRALKDTEADGLDPRDYHLPILEQLAGDGSALAAYEILHTDALLRVADHLSFGKVDPTSFDPHWNYGRAQDQADLSPKIESVVRSPDIYAEIEKLKPTHRMYVALKQELARFRQAAPDVAQLTVAPGQPIEPGTQDARVIALRARLAFSGDLDAAENNASDIYDPVLQAAVRRFQERMGLDADGKTGKRTIEELNVPVEERIRELRVNLDRGRVLLQELPNEFVVVNIAAYWVFFVRGQEIVWDARAQVGKTYRRTPMFRSAIDHLVFNPTWTVPPGILSKDIIPAARKDPASITRRGLRVLDAGGNEVDPASIDWSKFRSGNIPYTVRQDAGPKNALGRVKFMFPNSYSVYLHDTPSGNLFDSSDRAFSSGCVRVDRPLELAELLLGDTAKWDAAAIRRTVDSGVTQPVTLTSKVPVLLAYWTAWVDEKGRVNFRRDVYGQDAQWAAGLEQDYSPRKPSKSAAR